MQQGGVVDGMYWSVAECRWVPARTESDLYWSVQRCRWEPVGPAADALATPWSIFAAAQRAAGEAAPAVPGQRQPDPAHVDV